MSMALFLGAHVHDLHRAGSLSTTAFATWVAGLVLYVASIVGGRLYCGMHGFMDVSTGVILGTIGWVLQRLVMPEVERWIAHSGWSGAFVVSVSALA
jgi:membrane-associated phospholipid phosphatase